MYDDKRIDSDDQQGAMQQDSEEATDSHSDYPPKAVSTHRPYTTCRGCTKTGFSTMRAM